MPFVPDGNWTNTVVNSLGNTARDVLNFVIRNEDSLTDPAPGCEKIFTGAYSCGLNGTAKSISVDKPADGKTARFDCATEFAKCNDLRLVLTDDGKLTLTNTTGTKKFWDSVTAFGISGAFATSTDTDSAPVALDINRGNGIANSAIDVVAGGGPGRRYPNNYLEAGQFLESGQWIGSPNGTCRLMMGTAEFPNTLQVVKSVPNCDSLDTNSESSSTSPSVAGYTDLGCWNDDVPWALTLDRTLTNDNNPNACYQKAKSQGASIFALQNNGACFIANGDQDYKKYGKTPDTTSCPVSGGWYVNHVYQINPNADADRDATRLYTIPQTFVEHMGKAGHVDNQGQLQLYPNSMTSYGNNYEQIGNFNSLGSSYKTFSGSSLEDCKTKCTTGTYPDGTGDTQQCAGFVFDTTGAMCKLLDNTMYQSSMLIAPTSSYFAREKGIINQNISCPADIIAQTSDFWNESPKNNTPMSPSTKCGLAYYTNSERNTVGGDLTTVNGSVEYQDISGNLTNDLNYNDVKSNTTLYNKNKNTFRYWLDTLQDKYYKLTSLLLNTKSSLKSNLDELQESKQNLADWTGEQLQNLQAMNEDRDLYMMSQNYRHILWSILAIIIIIGTIKMTKAKAAV